MKAAISSSIECAAIACLALAICCSNLGCAGGNKLITNRDGLVESGKLVLDSIPSAPANQEYIIGPADVLDIIFPYNRDLSVQDMAVRPDGRITLPHVGEIVAAGKSASMLDSLLTERYSSILIDPQLAVVVKQFVRQMVYILGEVKDPGGYPYENRMTLLGALALARGPNEKAAANGVLVMRKIGPSHVIGIQIDYEQLLNEKRFDLDVPLQAGDIIYVPKSKLGKTKDFVAILYDILSKPSDLYIRGWQMANMEVLYSYYRRMGQL